MNLSGSLRLTVKGKISTERQLVGDELGEETIPRVTEGTFKDRFCRDSQCYTRSTVLVSTEEITDR